MKESIKYLREIRNKISHGNLEDAIEGISSYIKFNKNAISSSRDFEDLYRHIIIIRSQYVDLQNKIRIGIIEGDFASIQRNKIYKAVIDVLNAVEEDYNNLNLKTPSEQTKNLIEESIDKEASEGEATSITLTIDKNFDDFSSEEQTQLLNAIKGLLELKSDIRIKKIDKGSVLITLEIKSSEQAENLFLAVKTGALSKLGVTDAKLVSYIHNALSEIAINNSEKENGKSKISKIKLAVKDVLPKNIEKAINCLKPNLKPHSQPYDDLVGLYGRFTRNKNYQQNSLISYQEAESEYIKIEGAIIYLVNNLQEDDLS